MNLTQSLTVYGLLPRPTPPLWVATPGDRLGVWSSLYLQQPSVVDPPVFRPTVDRTTWRDVYWNASLQRYAVLGEPRLEITS